MLFWCSSALRQPYVPQMSKGGVSATFDSTPFPQGKKTWHHTCQSIYLKFGHRKIRLFVLSPETANPRVSDDVHRWYPGVLWEKTEEGGHNVIHPIHNFTRH